MHTRFEPGKEMTGTFNSPIRSRKIRIIKVGGSLFTLPTLKDRVLKWANQIQDREYVNVWIAGGGALVDEIRAWDDRHGLDQKTAHQISIDLASITAKLFHDLIEIWPLENDMDSLVATLNRLPTPINNVNDNLIFDCSHWANHCDWLPCSWDTTSDTIAFEVAKALAADQLYLAKSTNPVSNQIEPNRIHGVVDPNFATALEANARLQISIVNLRKSFELINLQW
jgi:aspartokinase-like uncharacterized kinase